MTKEEFKNLKTGEQILCLDSLWIIISMDCKPIAMYQGKSKDPSKATNYLLIEMHNEGYKVVKRIEGFKLTSELFPYSDFTRLYSN